MTVFFVYAPETTTHTIDPEEFKRQLQTRWPGVQAETSSVLERWLFYCLICQPVDAILDPDVPNTLLWYPILRPIVDPPQSDRVRYLPQLNDSPVLCRFNPEQCRLIIDGAGYTDCAVIALWLRKWLPEKVPVFARPEQEETAIEIAIDDTVASIVLRMLQAVEPENRLELASARPHIPLGVLPDAEVERLVRQILSVSK